MYDFVKLRPFQIIAFLISIFITIVQFWIATGTNAWKRQLNGEDIYQWNLWEWCIRKPTGQFECHKLQNSNKVNDPDAILVAQVATVLTIVLQSASVAVQVCGMNCTSLVDVNIKGQKYKSRIYSAENEKGIYLTH